MCNVCIDNHIGPEGALALADALRNNVTLQTLFLGGVPVPGGRAELRCWFPLPLHTAFLLKSGSSTFPPISGKIMAMKPEVQRFFVALLSFVTNI